MKILFLGDFYYDYDYITEDIKKISKYIKSNNLVTILNLEGTIETEYKVNKVVRLKFGDAFIEALKLLNVKAVNLANNHVMDYGTNGLKMLIKKLDDAGIGHFGAGLNLDEALNTYTMSIGKKKIAFGGYGWNMEECINAKKNSAGTAPIDFKMTSKVIDVTECDLFVPIFHYGYEYELLPQPYHLVKTRELMNKDKVKIIIGHHPHVVQAFEQNIYYSLGNFYFGSRRNDFYNNKKHSHYSNYGIGVIYDIDSNECEVIEIIYDGRNSSIVKSKHELLDITKIKTNNYLEYFNKTNRFFNKKFVYKNGWFNEKFLNNFKYYCRNCYKIYLRKFKWPLIKILKKIINKIR